MVEGLIGKKIGMTETFLEDGSMAVVTVLRAGPCYVVQKRDVERDGYEALQLGFEEAKPQRLTKPVLGHLNSAKLPPLKVLREFFVINGELSEYAVGDVIGVDIFNEGDTVDVTGKSKGKGFAGVMKKHGFSGQPDSHGGMSHRRPGSIGQHSYPGKVWKGIKMAGHQGAVNVTTQGLTVVRLDSEKNLILVKGAVPGPNGGLIFIKHTTKGRSKGG